MKSSSKAAFHDVVVAPEMSFVVERVALIGS
jgi:hypothetical protein